MANKSAQTALFQEAIAAMNAGQLRQAHDKLSEAIRTAPQFAEAHHLMGIVCSRSGHHSQAIRSLQQAIQLMPENAAFHQNLGIVYRKAENEQQALRCFLRAHQLDPAIKEAAINLAISYKECGKIRDALYTYQKIIAQHPKEYRAWYNLGNIYLEEGEDKKAIQHFEEAITLRPDDASSLNNLGIMFLKQGKPDDALSLFKDLCSKQPDFAEAWKNRHDTEIGLHHIAEARTSFDHYRALRSSKLNDLIAAAIAPVIFQSREEIEAYVENLHNTLDQLLYEQPKWSIEELCSSGIMPPLCLIDIMENDLPLRKKYYELLTPSLPKTVIKATSSRRHAGFVVTSGHEGAFTRCIMPVITRLASEMNVTIVCQGTASRQLLEAQTGNANIRFLQIPRSIKNALPLLFQAKFDVLYHWEVGTDPFNYILPYFTPARFQCTGWGWPTSTGNPRIDHFISGEALHEPLDIAYSEKVVNFPGLSIELSYTDEVKSTITKSELGLPSDANVYLVSQSLRKIHPDSDTLYQGILERDPNGHIAFLSDKSRVLSELLWKRLHQHMGGPASRIHMLLRGDHEHYLQVIKMADVLLDTRPNGGFMTTFDAFSMGKTVVTWPGNTNKGRVTSGGYSIMDIDGPVANSAEAFITMAVDYAQNKEKRRALEQRIQERKYRLFNPDNAATHYRDYFEELFETFK